MVEEVEVFVEIDTYLDDTLLEKADLNQLCRACASLHTNLLPIFEGDGLEHDLQAKIEQHFPVDISKDDGLPDQICYQCASTLVAWHEMFIGSINAENKLIKLLKKSKEDVKVKKEIEEASQESSGRSSSELECEIYKTAQVQLMKLEDLADVNGVQSDCQIADEKSDEECSDSSAANIQRAETTKKCKEPLQPDEECTSENDTNQELLAVNSSRAAVAGLKQDPCEESNSSVQDENTVSDRLNNYGFTSPTASVHCKKEKPYHCEFCDKTYSHKSTLNDHTRIHTGYKPFQCEICGKIYSRKQKLKEHTRIHSRHDHTNVKVKPENPSSNDDSSVHDENAVSDRLNNDGFTSPTASVHCKKEKPYHCEFCDKTYSQNSTLNYHTPIHSVYKPFQCEICGKIYSGNKKLKLPTKLQNSVQREITLSVGDKPFQCEFCSKCFRRKEALNEHIRTHTGERPFQCKTCGKRFTQRSQLMNHNRMHTGEKPFQCAYCSKCFSSKASLESHIRRHTGERPFQCEHCSKSFAHRFSFFTHIKTHTGERPYQCGNCGKKFSTKGKMIDHIRTHTGERPYQCAICNKAFTLKVTLNRHIRMVHSRE